MDNRLKYINFTFNKFLTNYGTSREAAMQKYIDNELYPAYGIIGRLNVGIGVLFYSGAYFSIILLYRGNESSKYAAYFNCGYRQNNYIINYQCEENNVWQTLHNL